MIRPKKFTANGYPLSRGFSLLEVLIALSVFAYFITSYVASEGLIMSNSVTVKNELQLQKLADDVLARIQLEPPKFNKSLTLAPETKAFEEEGLGDYQYTLTYSQLEIPNLSEIKGEEDAETEQQKKDNTISKKVFTEIQSYIQKKIWQVVIKVEHKPSGEFVELASWLNNPKAKPKVSL